MRNASDYLTWSDDDMATQRPFGVAKGVDTGMASQAIFEDNNGKLGHMSFVNEGRKSRLLV